MKEMHFLETDQQTKSRYMSGWGVFDFKDGSSVLISDGVVLAGSATLLVLPKAGVVIACLTNTATGVMDDLAFKIADLFSGGLLANLASVRKEVEVADTVRAFHADRSQRGSWVGTVDTPTGKLPVRMQISGDNHMQIGFGHSVMVPVEGLGIEQEFLGTSSVNLVASPDTP
jgi:hypothetical protein